MLKLLDKIIFLISIIAMSGLAGAYASSYINPNHFVYLSLLGLAYPYLLISNLVLFLYWIVRWKKMAWAELVIILSGTPAFMTYYGTADTEEKTQNYDFSVISYNVRYFDFYNWSNQKNTKNKLFNYLKEFKGNIICLQEFTLQGNTSNEQALVRQLQAYPYRHIHKDMAIFSRLPIISKGHLSFGEQTSASCLYCDVVTPVDTVRLYNIHLESYKLGKKERQFMKEISQGIKTNDLPGSAKKLTSRLTTANKNRAQQADQIKRHLLQSPHQAIICGDFNDTPLSYTYKKIKTNLKDAFIEKGRGLGNTYIGEFPSFRIDYILHTPGLETVSYNRELIELSDHYPVKAKLKLKKKIHS